MKRKIKPMGHKQMMSFLRDGRLFFDDMMSNNRKANCKICGKDLGKYEGIRWLKFAPNGFYFQSNYFCAACSAFANSVCFNPNPRIVGYSPEQRRLIWEYISQHWKEF